MWNLLGKFNKENRVVEITEVHELKTNFFSRILYKRSGRKAQKITIGVGMKRMG